MTLLRVFASALLVVCALGITIQQQPSVAVQRQIPNEPPWVIAEMIKNDTQARAEQPVFPVPTTSRCIVIMCCQYMVFYLALALVRVWHEFTATPKGELEDALKTSCQTLTYGPMLCVLFIACRMHVEFLSKGQGQPQEWVQTCMYAVTFAVLANALVVLCVPLISGKPLAVNEKSGDMEQQVGDSPEGRDTVWYILTATRYLIMLGLYGGLLGVLIGINTYLPPGYERLDDVPWAAPAIVCTMIIAVLFFSTQLVIAGCRTYTEFTGVSFDRVVGVMHAAATTVEFGPMLAILFLCLRMRALQHGSQPQRWAQMAMFASTFALATTTVLAIAVPLALNGSMQTNSRTGEATFKPPDDGPGALGIILVVLRYLCMACFYGGAAVVVYAILIFEAEGRETLPISPTVHCVMQLACQFFFVYLCMTIMMTVQELSGGKYRLEDYSMFSSLDAAKATVQFAPMLAILFVTVRMYSLLITNGEGAPQRYVQEGMYMATWALFLSFMMCLVTGLLAGEVKQDRDGNVINEFTNPYAAAFVTFVRFVSMFMLYVGEIIIIYGLFAMTPENANGTGSVAIVSDIVRSTPFSNHPPGPGDLSKHGF